MINLIADVLVASLLVATIITCFILTKRIERLKTDEAGMRQTVGALITATDNAERAIAGLKSTLGDCDRTLEERLRTAGAGLDEGALIVEACERIVERGGVHAGSRRLLVLSMEGLRSGDQARHAAARGGYCRMAQSSSSSPGKSPATCSARLPLRSSCFHSSPPRSSSK